MTNLGRNKKLKCGRVSHSGLLELKEEYLYPIPTTLYLTELDNVVPYVGLVVDWIQENAKLLIL